uniref:Phosphatidylinositol transfer protein n=1 Tax=Meloidogyne hapla TaxID=6305 RepID=A0A1I8BAM5_MELHA
MVLLKEYRICLPMTLAELHKAEMFTFINMAVKESKNGEGVRISVDKHFQDEEVMGIARSGRFTRKEYKIKSKIPFWARPFLPKKFKFVHEDEWNAHPYSKKEIYVPGLKDDYLVKVTSICVKDDRGKEQNVFNLDIDDLRKRQISVLDIGKENKSMKTNRGQLYKNWIDGYKPIVCIYMLVNVQCKYLEKKIEEKFRELTLKFYKNVFISIDLWCTLTFKQVEAIVKESKAELEDRIKSE